jgi:hypothetical protein
LLLITTWAFLPLAGLFILWGTPASSQPILQVWGTADSLAMRNQVAQYMDYLDVNENVYVSVSVGFTAKMPEKLEGMTFCLDSTACNTYLIIRVWIDARLSKTRQKLVLAHEMIHVKQYAKGELIVNNNQQVLWKRQKFWYQEANEWQRALWELEAYKKDKWLTGQYKSQPEAPLVAVVKNLENSILTLNEIL